MERPKKVSLKDIAERASVSTALVSYVLNGRHSNRIKTETADRIKAIAAELDYRPDFLAKALKSQRTYTIGLVLADLANPFSAQVARIIENEAQRSDYIVLMGSTDENKTAFREVVSSFIDRQVDGMILLPAAKCEDEIQRVHDKGIPYVLMDRYFPQKPFNFVINDNYYATYTATEQLIRSGRKQIVLVTLDIPLSHIEDRKKGFLDACRNSGILGLCLVREVNGNRLGVEVAEALDMLFETNAEIDALLFTTDLLALYGMRYAIKNKLRVPDMIDIMAVDEAPYYDIFPSKITYYKQPLEKMGRKAMDFLISKIENDQGQTIQEIIKGNLVLPNTNQGDL
ncbi:LacI family DNA-binding transcriptional regulator [Flagellimonas sp. DF-77]|uniref:LacI family DNA-binding transcriptional regulator n=1 Tax=Flagellimonas algarum TaxID=3230298 RepID=UPI003393E6E3